VLLGLLGGNVWFWVLLVAMFVAGSFRCQCVLGLLGGNVCCLVFDVAMCGFGSFW